MPVWTHKRMHMHTQMWMSHKLLREHLGPHSYRCALSGAHAASRPRNDLSRQPLTHILQRTGLTSTLGTLNAAQGERWSLAATNGSSAQASSDLALVWFKADLRLDDNPIIHAAQQAKRMLPVFCFDPRLYRALLRTPNGLEGLIGALESLRRSLRAQGSELLVCEGPADEILLRLAEQHGADAILAEEEVEHRWIEEVVALAAKLPATLELRLQRASMFTSEPYSDDFRQFQAQRGEPIPPLSAPSTLPGVPPGLQPVEEGDGRLERWRRMVQEADEQLTSPQVREASSSFEEGWATGDPHILRELAHGGEEAAQDMLRDYLACGAPSSTPACERMAAAVDRAESRATPLGSFPALFAHALALGVLSRRRVFADAEARLAGLSRLERAMGGGGVAARSAAVTVEAADFHWHVARADRARDSRTGAAPRHWRWRGFLTDYFTADPEEYGAEAPDPDAPAFLLVHGFGAFGEQWRGQIRVLAAAGHRVFAPTLPGYGRSEKPSLPYSQYLWVAYLRDFVVEVVRRPVVVAGNSIGGFISASLAADYSALVQGLVLFNSAGLIRKDFRADENGGGVGGGGGPELPDPAIGPPGFLADLASRALLFYLEKTVARTLTRVYPVNPEMADTWLVGEIARAAGDPGAQKVFRSVFYLPKPRPLNYLVKDLFGGPTLILQGARDPLQNARGRAASMDRLCPNVSVVLLDAGHCPFDEQPGLVNGHLLNFAASIARSPAPPAEDRRAATAV